MSGLTTFEGRHLNWDGSLRFDKVLLEELRQAMDSKEYGSVKSFTQQPH
jgi:hypothetical protein